MESYKIPRKKSVLTRNVSESSISHEEDSERKKATPSKRNMTKTLHSPGYKEQDILDVIRIVDKTNTEEWPPYRQEVTKTALVNEQENFISQLTMDSPKLDIEEDIHFSQDSIKADEVIQEIPEISEDIIKDSADKEENTDGQEVERSYDTSLNDTPGKVLVEQITQYNRKINQDSPDYGESPIQKQHDETVEVMPESVAEPLLMLTVPMEAVVAVIPERVADPPVIATALAF